MGSMTPDGKLIFEVGLCIYILAMLVIGYVSGRKVRDMNDFLVAGRRLPFWMATATLLATWFGAGSSMGVAATVYSGSLRDVIADPFAASISLVLAGFFVVGLLRRNNCLTVTDIVERQYGKSAGIYATVWLLPVYIGWLGAQVIGLGTILHVLTGINALYGMLIGAAIVLIYTASGGMWAVTLTDVIQVSIIVIGLGIIVPGAVQQAGGFSEVFAGRFADCVTLAPAETSFRGTVNYLGNWMVMGLGCIVGQDLIQRSLASRTEKVAAWSSVTAGILYMLIGMIPITIGLAAKILFPRWGLDAAALGDGDLSNQVLPRVAVHILGSIHPVMLTLFICALASAIMSSADSSLLAASSLFSNNVLKPLCPKISDKRLLMVTRIVTVVILVIATVLAMKVQSIYALMVNCWASQLVIVFVPVVTALYLPKAGKRCAWAAMGAATVVWIGYMALRAISQKGSFVEIMESDFFQYELTNGAVYGFAASVLAFALVYFTRAGKKTLPEKA